MGSFAKKIKKFQDQPSSVCEETPVKPLLYSFFVLLRIALNLAYSTTYVKVPLWSV
jgi:hypothetical protein